MSDNASIIIAIIVAIPATISAIGAFMAVLGIQGVHKLVNSRLTELLEITRKNSRAEGVIEGKAARKDE